jgi:hypothetical protein
VVLHVADIHAKPFASEPCEECQGTDGDKCRDYRQGRGNIPGRKQLQPMQAKNCHPANPAKDYSHNDCPKGPTQEKRISGMDYSVCTLMYQRSGPEALPRNFPKCFPRFILSCKISNKSS